MPRSLGVTIELVLDIASGAATFLSPQSHIGRFTRLGDQFDPYACDIVHLKAGQKRPTGLELIIVVADAMRLRNAYAHGQPMPDGWDAPSF